MCVCVVRHWLTSCILYYYIIFWRRLTVSLIIICVRTHCARKHTVILILKSLYYIIVPERASSRILSSNRLLSSWQTGIISFSVDFKNLKKIRLFSMCRERVPRDSFCPIYGQLFPDALIHNNILSREPIFDFHTT